MLLNPKSDVLICQPSSLSLPPPTASTPTWRLSWITCGWRFDDPRAQGTLAGAGRALRRHVLPTTVLPALSRGRERIRTHARPWGHAAARRLPEGTAPCPHSRTLVIPPADAIRAALPRPAPPRPQAHVAHVADCELHQRVCRVWGRLQGRVPGQAVQQQPVGRPTVLWQDGAACLRAGLLVSVPVVCLRLTLLARARRYQRLLIDAGPC